jgi:hypothetical protein
MSTPRHQNVRQSIQYNRNATLLDGLAYFLLSAESFLRSIRGTTNLCPACTTKEPWLSTDAVARRLHTDVAGSARALVSLRAYRVDGPRTDCQSVVPLMARVLVQRGRSCGVGGVPPHRVAQRHRLRLHCLRNPSGAVQAWACTSSAPALKRCCVCRSASPSLPRLPEIIPFVSPQCSRTSSTQAVASPSGILNDPVPVSRAADTLSSIRTMQPHNPLIKYERPEFAE